MDDSDHFFVLAIVGHSMNDSNYRYDRRDGCMRVGGCVIYSSGSAVINGGNHRVRFMYGGYG